MTPTSLERVILGGRFGERPQDESDRLVATFADAGGVWVETAHSYANGRAERSVAAAIASCPRQLSIITKVGHPDARGASTLEGDALTRQIELSTTRLKRPIDALLLHRDDERSPVEVLLEPVARAVEAGLVTHVGLANWSLSRAAAAHRLLERGLWAISLQLSLVVPSRPLWDGTRAATGADVDWSAGAAVALLAWSPLGRGWVPNVGTAPPEARRAFSTAANQRVVDACDQLALRYGCSRSAVALAGVLACGGHVQPIVGAERLEEIADATVAVALARQIVGGELDHLVRQRLHATSTTGRASK